MMRETPKRRSWQKKFSKIPAIIVIIPVLVAGKQCYYLKTLFKRYELPLRTVKFTLKASLIIGTTA